MPNQIFLTRPVAIKRKDNTIEISDTERGKSSRAPILQISEIYALYGAEPDGPALSLLSEHKVPLHCFEGNCYAGTWMPYQSILSGQVSQSQYTVLFDHELRIQLAQEITRGALRLRCLVAKNSQAGSMEYWEDRYLKLLSNVYTSPKSALPCIFESVGEIDYERREISGISLDILETCSGFARAAITGAFSRLSLDPWVGVIPKGEKDNSTLIDDMFFLFEPLFVDIWPTAKLPRFPFNSETAVFCKQHLSRTAARDGGRIWSIRSLPVREGYALISSFMGESNYRAARGVGFPKDVIG